MPRPHPPHLHRQITRHGKTLWYVRFGKGPRTRIQGAYGSAEFNEAYEAAIAGKPKPVGGEAAAWSLRWLVKRYMESSAWAKLSGATRKQRGCIFLGVLKTAADLPYADITRKHIADGRERRKATPYQARHFVDTMRGLFLWAVEAEHLAEDPTLGVKAPTPKTDGHHTWTPEECAAFEEKHAVGTRERLAYDVLLYTGLRRGDAARLGRQHVRNSVITIKTEKTGEVVVIPILPPLAASLEATKSEAATFITGGSGKPFSKEGFGNWFGEVCNLVGVPGTAHGLRKAGATRAAENGATESELEAIFGWRGGRMASKYTRQANRMKLAKQAAMKLLPDQEPAPGNTTSRSEAAP